MKRDLLYASIGCGSVLVELACALASYPIDIVDLEWTAKGITDPRLKALNPLCQVPTLVTPKGDVLTESAAIIMWLADRYPESGLAPKIWSGDRAQFLHWLSFINASTYATFTYGDFPEKWAGPEGAARLGETTLQRRIDNHIMLNQAAKGPFFMGANLSAIDLYIVAMVNWRPGRDWFAVNAPTLLAIATKVSEDVFLRPILVRNQMLAD
jgi:GST-like protein